MFSSLPILTGMGRENQKNGERGFFFWPYVVADFLLIHVSPCKDYCPLKGDHPAPSKDFDGFSVAGGKGCCGLRRPGCDICHVLACTIATILEPLSRLIRFTVPWRNFRIFFNDLITDDLASYLASVRNGDLQPVQNLIKDSSVNEWVRSTALQSLVELWSLDQLDRILLVNYFAYLCQSGLKRELPQV